MMSKLKGRTVMNEPGQYSTQNKDSVIRNKSVVHSDTQYSKGVIRDIYCTGCERLVEARLTNGAERYPHRPDLYDLPFWKCDVCGAYVGCHHKTVHPTEPLGYLATPAILDARKKIHALLDPLWKSGRIKRGQAYAYVGNRIGHPYHNGEIKTIEEGREIYKIVAQLHNEVNDLVATDKEPK